MRRPDPPRADVGEKTIGTESELMNNASEWKSIPEGSLVAPARAPVCGRASSDGHLQYETTQRGVTYGQTRLR